jgi:hypothetical protein
LVIIGHSCPLASKAYFQYSTLNDDKNFVRNERELKEKEIKSIFFRDRRLEFKQIGEDRPSKIEALKINCTDGKK